MPGSAAESFRNSVAQKGVPELTTLAATVEQWWPEILGFLQLRITNARTGAKPTIKTIKRAGCGFRKRTVPTGGASCCMLHIAATAA